MARKRPRRTPKTVETLTHEEANRRNIPTVELQPVMRDEELNPVRVAYGRRNRDLDPQLVWRGKDGQDWSDLIVPAPPLYIQEKVHPKALIDDLARRGGGSGEASGEQIDLFADFNGLPDGNARTEFYRHDANWSNRMILGDSLQVMASLAEREGLRGKVQCIYIDPPYGIRFNSNFQWSTTSRDVRDGKAEHITREPEQVKAFRDTWRDGIHSYLTYLRDRLTVARDLLADSGSVFVQIGDENVHRVRSVMDEVFGEDNHVSQISFRTTTGLGDQHLDSSCNFLIWYTKNRTNVKYRELFKKKGILDDVGARYRRIEIGPIDRRPMTAAERTLSEPLPAGAKIYRHDNLTSQSGSEKSAFTVEFRSGEFKPSRGFWKTNQEGMQRLKRSERRARAELGGVGDPPGGGRAVAGGGGCGVERRPVRAHRRREGGGPAHPEPRPGPKLHPGRPGTIYPPPPPRFPWDAGPTDLHRRWWEARIARQREVDASIAARADFEYLYDRPYEDRKKVRTAGPFTVESLSPHRTLAVDENDELIDRVADTEGRYGEETGEAGFTAMILENLKTAGVQQAHREDRIAFTALFPWPGHFVCAEGRYVEGGSGEGDGNAGPEKRAAVFVGPEFGTVSRPDLAAAAREAGDARFDVLVACAFNYDAHSSELDRLGRIPVLKARMNADLHMAGDLKNTGKGNLFVIFGEPDVEILDAAPSPEAGKGAPSTKDGDEQGERIQVRINGVDVFDPNTSEVRSDDPDGIACWFIDTDYDEESFFVRHAYFLGANDPYKALKTTLKAEIDPDAWAALNSAVSRPFPKPRSGRIAVKVINRLGDEVMKVFRT